MTTTTTLVPVPVSSSATAVAMTMTRPSSHPVPAPSMPRKLSDDDDDDDDHALMAGGPFENAKRKCSWSATSMRKELGSPRMANSENVYTHSHSCGVDASSSARHGVGQALSQQQQQQLLHNRQHVSTAAPSLRKKERSCSRNTGTTFLQELGSALVSCGGGGEANSSRSRPDGSDTSSNSNSKIQPGSSPRNKCSHNNYSHEGSPSDLMTVAASWGRLKDSFQKAVQGDLDAAKEAWRKSALPLNFTSDDFAVTSVGSHDSILTYDNYSVINQRQAQLIQQEEEAMQLRRLTSWGTVGTYETVETTATGTAPGCNGGGNGTGAADSVTTHTLYYSKSTGDTRATLNRATNGGPGDRGVVEDDDGIPIDVHLLQTRGKRSQVANGKSGKSAATRRKRVVRFDYPPISSLRECPRTQPDQIEDLFFTEHELEQIEDDRYSTISADDVEIVAISTSTTGESESAGDDPLESRAAAAGNNAGHATNNCSTKTPSLPKSPSSPHANSQATPKDANLNDPSFRNYVATPSKPKRDSKKGRRAFSFDDVVSGKGVTASNSSATNESSSHHHHHHHHGHNVNNSSNNKKSHSRRRKTVSDALSSTSNSVGNSTAQSQKGTPSSSSVSSRRMIKSVQIYLRERSVG